MSQTIPDNSGKGNAGEYDSVNNLFYTNFYDRNAITSATSLTSVDGKTQSELFALHDGVTVFTKRDDIPVDEFRIFAYSTGTTFTSAEKIQLKQVCDHDPDLQYNDVTTINEIDVSANDYQYNSTVDAYFGQVYQTSASYVMQFTSGDYRTYDFNIPFVDPDTGRSGSISASVEYQAPPTFTIFTDTQAIILQNGENANPESFTDIEAIILQNGGL
jgi:hypothetical protein